MASSEGHSGDRHRARGDLVAGVLRPPFGRAPGGRTGSDGTFHSRPRQDFPGWLWRGAFLAFIAAAWFAAFFAFARGGHP